MVRQSNTVCRNVRRKPAHSVEHKGFRIFGWSLPAPCKLPQREKTRQKAKTTPVSREERGWRSSSKSMLHLQMSNVCQILFRPTALLFIPHTTLLTAPSVPSQEDIRVLNQAAPAYLHSRKPEVPSGPLGWRITWLFERTGSSGCCTLIQAGLIMVREKLEYITKQCFSLLGVFFKTFCCHSWFCRHYNSPVLALIVLRRLFWRSTTQNPPSGFCILCLSLGQRLHLLSRTRRGSGVSCVAVICRAL